MGARIISLLNQKGGVGKTTMSFNLAHAFKNLGKKVLCIDMDPQANLTILFGLNPDEIEFSIHQLLLNSVRELKPLHRPVMCSDVLISTQGIDVLPSGQELSGFELSVAGINYPRQLILSRFIKANGLDDLYDFIVIDGPPTLGLIVVNILCASTGVMVPFQPDQFSRKGLSHFHEVLEDIEEMGITDAPQVIGYIPNLVDQRRKQVEKDFISIRQDLDDQNEAQIFESFANKVQLVKSAAQHKSVFDYQSKEFNEIKGQFTKMAEYVQTRLP